MQIRHVAIWVSNLDVCADFYVRYFKARRSEKYFNHTKNFSSVFLHFEGGTSIELMHTPNAEAAVAKPALGYAHLAIGVGSAGKVDALTQLLLSDGYTVISPPRKTGDGYYESLVADVDGNYIEITV